MHSIYSNIAMINQWMEWGTTNFQSNPYGA